MNRPWPRWVLRRNGTVRNGPVAQRLLGEGQLPGSRPGGCPHRTTRSPAQTHQLTSGEARRQAWPFCDFA